MNKWYHRSVSFRWTQGFIPNGAEATTWALDNVYIGAGCLGDCGGHGSCINGLLCQCDEGYGGDQCAPIQHNPRFLKEDFTGRSQEFGGLKDIRQEIWNQETWKLFRFWKGIQGPLGT